MEIPNIIAQQNLSSESSLPPEVSLPAEPSVSDISSIMPSGEPSEIVPPITETPLHGSEIPQIAPNEISTHEEPQVPSTSAQEDAATIQTSDMLQMENMGYDQVSWKTFILWQVHEDIEYKNIKFYFLKSFSLCNCIITTAFLHIESRDIYILTETINVVQFR